MTHPSRPPIPELQETANPVLVLQSRGGLTESFARGAFAIADAGGTMVAELGATDRPVYPRSAIKIIQAVGLVSSGAADAFKLGATELALACASHSGEPAHVEAVARWLAKIGATEQDLVCFPHPPLDAGAAAALVKEGRAPSRLHHNCSGKHTGFLTLARHLGAPFKGYDHLDHPVQARAAEALSKLSGVRAADLITGIDGCGAPNFALSLGALATAFARIADPPDLREAERAAFGRLLEAAHAQPFFTAGSGRLCTRIMSEAPGIYVKTGAEGVYVAAIPALGLGIALKVDDGGKHASEALIVALLVGSGALDPDSPLVRETAIAPVRNAEGKIVGAREVALELLIETLAEFSPQALAAAGGARPQVELPAGMLAV